MGSYWDVRRPSSSCVHFVYKDQAERIEPRFPKELADERIDCVYVDYLETKKNGEHVVDAIARLSNLESGPYKRLRSRPEDIWQIFSGDLKSRLRRKNGIVIILDNSDTFLSENSQTMFQLIEAFMTPLRHWQKKKRPYHLCFQMEQSKWVRQLFVGPESPEAADARQP